MSTQVKNTIANSIIVAIFTMMIAGIASWMVSAINNNTKAVQANTGQAYKYQLVNQEEHGELTGLIIGINYEIAKVTSDCEDNKLAIGNCRALYMRKGNTNGL